MKEVVLKSWGEATKVRVDATRRYAQGGAIVLDGWCDEGHFATFSVNLPQYPLMPGETWIKTWSENAGFLEQLEEKEIVTRIGQKVIVGHNCTAVAVKVLIPTE